MSVRRHAVFMLGLMSDSPEWWTSTLGQVGICSYRIFAPPTFIHNIDNNSSMKKFGSGTKDLEQAVDLCDVESISSPKLRLPNEVARRARYSNISVLTLLSLLGLWVLIPDIDML